MSINAAIHRLLYRTLSLDSYLKCVSRMFFVLYGLGIGRNARGTEYAHHLDKLVDEGDTVIDIGANLGYYSRVLSGLVGKNGTVYSVEPVQPILSVLKHNLRRCKNVQILNYALGEQNKSITMINDTARRNGYMGTGQNYVADSAETHGQDACFEARMRRGSELFASLERLDFIKCDIEGYEWVVMSEMKSIIERFHPNVLIETGGDNRPKIIELFTSLGYEAFTLERQHEVALTKESDKDIIFRYRS